jgi:hypothetical protein
VAVVQKFSEGDRVAIADRPEVHRFAGRVGVIYGWTKPSKSKVHPVHGHSSDDFAWSVYFHDTGEQEWFRHYLLAPAN